MENLVPGLIRGLGMIIAGAGVAFVVVMAYGIVRAALEFSRPLPPPVPRRVRSRLVDLNGKALEYTPEDRV